MPIKKIAIVILLFIILFAGHAYHYLFFNKKLEVLELNKANLRTGDVIMCYGNPIYEKWKTGKPPMGYLISTLLVRNISIIKEGHPYFHVIIVIKDGDRFLLYDFTDTECHDVIKDKLVSNCPMVIDINTLNDYMGLIYLFRYRGPDIQLNVENLVNKIDSMQLSPPENHTDIILCHCLKVKKKNKHEGSCIDLAEIILEHLGFNNKITLMGDSTDILNIIEPTHDVSPTILSNICHKKWYIKNHPE